MFSFLESNTLKLRKKTEAQLENYTRPSLNFLVLMTLSSAMATLGLILDNAAIVIGAMVIAPLITPLFGLALSTLLFRIKTIGRSFSAIFLGTVIGIITSILISILVVTIDPAMKQFTHEILIRTTPNVFYLFVAILSGMAGAFAYGRPEVSERIVGIAIAVALIPPLTVSGIGIAFQDITIAQNSFLLYLINLAGILFGSILMFIILGFRKNIEEEGVLE